jgi:hypothetical protein
MTRVSRLASRAFSAGLGVWMVGLAACLGTACVDSLEMRPFDHSLGDLSSADRIEVAVAGVTQVATITDGERVRAVVAVVGRYNTGWIDVWSGAGGEHVVTLYSGKKMLNSFGIGPAGINDGSYARRLSKKELDELVNLLGIPPREAAPAGR